MLDRQPQALRRIRMVRENSEASGPRCTGLSAKMSFGKSVDLLNLSLIGHRFWPVIGQAAIEDVNGATAQLARAVLPPAKDANAPVCDNMQREEQTYIAA